MCGGGESWGLEKKKARTHPVTFPGSRPWAKVHTATPSWLAQGPTASTPKGHRGRAASYLRGQRFQTRPPPSSLPLTPGRSLHSEEAQTGTVLLYPSCFYPGGPSAIIRAPSSASGRARLGLAGGGRAGLLGLF